MIVKLKMFTEVFKKNILLLNGEKTMSIVTELKIKMLYLFFLGNAMKWMALATENSRGVGGIKMFESDS